MRTSPLTRPVRVKDVLVSAVPGLRERMLEDTIRTSWPRIVGPQFSRQSRPGSLRTGTLDVLVDNSPLLHEMKLRSGELLAALQAFRPDTVSALRLTLGARAPERATRPTKRMAAPPRLAPEQTQWVDAMVAPVSDTALAASLRRVLTKDLLSHRPRGSSHGPDSSPLDKDTA